MTDEHSWSDVSALDAVTAVVLDMLDAAVLLSRRFEVVDYNTSYLLMAGLNRRQLDRRLAEGKSIFDVLVSEGDKVPVAAERAAATLRPMRLQDVDVTRGDGSKFTTVVSLTPLTDTSGAFAAMIVSYRDITGEARMHDHYHELLTAERAKAQELEGLVMERTAELQMALDEVTRLSEIDPLTELYNRRAFARQAGSALALATRHDFTVAIVLIDLDHFKKVNDVHGHAAGDAVLIAVAGRLRKAVRRSDIVARFGGEELVVFFSKTEPYAAGELGEKCRLAVEGPLSDVISAAAGNQTASVGVAVFRQHGNTLDELLAAADEALYRAKAAGRNRVELALPRTK